MLSSPKSSSVSSCASSRAVAHPILRRACDRCHAQKLSCQRNGNDPCARCTKLKTTCTSSPSLRNRRNRPLQRRATRAPAAAPPEHENQAHPQAHPEPSAERPAVGSRPRAPSALSAPLADSAALEDLDAPILDLLRAPAAWQDHQHQSSDASQVFDQTERIAYHDTSSGTFVWDTNTAFSAADLHLPSLLSHTSAPPADNAMASCPLRSLDASTPQTSPSIDGAPMDMFFYLGAQADSGKVTGSNTDIWSSTSDSAATLTSITSARSSHMDVRPSSRTTPSPSSTRSHEPQRRPSQTDGQWLQKLLEINVQLFNHGNQVIDQSSSTAGDCSSRSDKSAPDKPSSTGNSFDQTLLLSLQFIQALRKVHGSSSRDLPSYTTASPAPTLDQGTALIIYSCYIRVLELFTDRLNTLKGALDAATTASINQENDATHSPTSTVIPPLDLPTLSACSCPLEAFPVLKVRITLELIEEVLDVMSALLLPIIRGPGGSRQRQEEELAMPWRGQMFMPEVSQQSLLAREEGAYQIIRDIRRGFRTSRRAMIS